MIPHKKHARVAAGVLLLLSADFASAQQTVEDSGIATYVRDNQVYELEKGHIVVVVNEKGILIADDPSLPTHNTTSDCIGMFEEFPDGTYKGSGYCTNTDHREGHKLFVRWSALRAKAPPPSPSFLRDHMGAAFSAGKDRRSTPISANRFCCGATEQAPFGLATGFQPRSDRSGELRPL
jgi:hypothetical protein